MFIVPFSLLMPGMDLTGVPSSTFSEIYSCLPYNFHCCVGTMISRDGRADHLFARMIHESSWRNR